METTSNGCDPTRVDRMTSSFVNDDLSNWHARLNRKRFRGKEISADKRSVCHTLYTCLMTVGKLLAPFAPFYINRLYLDSGGKTGSVHLGRSPAVDKQLVNKDLEAHMDLVRRVTSMTLALCRKMNTKVCQPLM